MKQLKLIDGFVANCADESSITNIIITVASFAAVDEIKNEMTEANMLRCEFDGEVVMNVTPLTIVAEKDGTSVIVTVTTRLQTADELRDAEIKEMQDAIAELAEIVGGAE